MTYTVGLKQKFADELQRFPQDQKLKVAGFIAQYQADGLDDFSKYAGKIAPSWSGLQATDPLYAYAYTNALWHYHIGIPAYRQTHPKYQTSDWLLHFQWASKGARIELVDLYQHYTWDGRFHLPSADYLVGQQAATAPAVKAAPNEPPTS